ncbi:hypothetical protein KM043_010702 [Ampulex compressa]|nr:hypothetical protein KM043_010702 [Ampulex compressa]
MFVCPKKSPIEERSEKELESDRNQDLDPFSNFADREESRGTICEQEDDLSSNLTVRRKSSRTYATKNSFCPRTFLVEGQFQL